jgi:hypothetical protein
MQKACPAQAREASGGGRRLLALVGCLALFSSTSIRAQLKGRELDHLGFDVTNIEEFEKRLTAQGLKFDAPPRQVPNTQTKGAFLTDPWGAYIEVTEHLAP